MRAHEPKVTGSGRSKRSPKPIGSEDVTTRAKTHIPLSDSYNVTEFIGCQEPFFDDICNLVDLVIVDRKRVWATLRTDVCRAIANFFIVELMGSKGLARTNAIVKAYQKDDSSGGSGADANQARELAKTASTPVAEQ